MLRKQLKSRTKASKVKNPDAAQEIASEYRYASHHHLIPLYILSGISIVALVMLACFLAVLWQFNERESFRPSAITTVQNIENKYLPSTIVPTEKKQYIYTANIRFPISNPYSTIRYEYDPGVLQTKTSMTVTLTTTRTLQSLEAPVLENPARTGSIDAKMQECAKLYIVRFEPGLTQYGNFIALKDIKLKDGRTAYIHKNTTCVPDSVQAMNELDATEQDLLAIESF